MNMTEFRGSVLEITTIAEKPETQAKFSGSGGSGRPPETINGSSDHPPEEQPQWVFDACFWDIVGGDGGEQTTGPDAEMIRSMEAGLGGAALNGGLKPSHVISLRARRNTRPKPL